MRDNVRVHATLFTQKGPIRLFDVQEMKLVSRASVTNYIVNSMPLHNLTPDDSTIQAHIQATAKYAILSHRWADDEILFSDIQHLGGPRTHIQRFKVPGKAEAQEKLDGFFEAARKEGCRLVWFDSGCIDKSNGPEVDESIRSMFTWYQNAHVCIVYLQDTWDVSDLSGDEWYERGWTLQELLAPKKLKFFNRRWTRLVGKAGHYDIDRISGVCDPEIQKATREAFGTHDIDLSLTVEPHPDNAATVFAYARNRVTTRPEDMAYCLLSLLDIHIPIVYGEGAERAFYRLQIACLQETTSRSLFQWKGAPNRWNSLLSQSPSNFATWSHQPPISFDIFDLSSSVDESFTFNNNGMHIMMFVFDLTSSPISSTIQLEEPTWEGDKSTRLACSLLARELDTSVEFHHSTAETRVPDLDKWTESAVIAIFGWVGEVSQAVVLERGNRASRRGYSRSPLSDIVSWKKLPTATDLNESKIEPQWIYIK